MLDGPDVLKYIEYNMLKYVGHRARMDRSRIPKTKKAQNGIYQGRRPVGRPRLRWEHNINRDSSLLLNIRGWRRLTGGRDIWRRNVEQATTVAPMNNNNNDNKR